MNDIVQGADQKKKRVDKIVADKDIPSTIGVICIVRGWGPSPKPGIARPSEGVKFLIDFEINLKDKARIFGTNIKKSDKHEHEDDDSNAIATEYVGGFNSKAFDSYIKKTVKNAEPLARELKMKNIKLLDEFSVTWKDVLPDSPGNRKIADQLRQFTVAQFERLVG